jgi:nicotinate-nucleotide adenylyltransferase
MRIGILGGSFNPPHLGHVYISLQSAKRQKLDQIWWLPAKQNPLKQDILLKSLPNNFKNRLNLCQQITKNYPKILVKDLEKDLSSIYSIDLIKKIIKQNSQHNFFWIIGADNILKFHLWKSWQKIIELTPLIICNRDNVFYLATKSKAFLFAKKLQKVCFLKIKKLNISSTKIRKNNEL